MFKKIYVEKRVLETTEFLSLKEKLKLKNFTIINKIDEIWGRVKKPYLQKRDNLNLFIGKKDGTLLKEAPDAYGLGSEKHFYYVHAYNCIYECEYCYLQGYFKTPDIVFFINHNEIKNEMQKTVDQYPDAWFHAGEFSDSLALSHYTGEITHYYDFFKNNPDAKLELRTKSVNTKELESLRPLPNIFLSFSLSSSDNAKSFDRKCPSIKARLSAIKKMNALGYNIGIHLDPITYKDSFELDYKELILSLQDAISLDQISYISIGVVRYTSDVYKEVQKNYSKSLISTGNFIKSFDGKVRYNRPMRNWMMNKVKNELIKHGAFEDRIYFCME